MGGMGVDERVLLSDRCWSHNLFTPRVKSERLGDLYLVLIDVAQLVDNDMCVTWGLCFGRLLLVIYDLAHVHISYSIFNLDVTKYLNQSLEYHWNLEYET